MYDASSRAREEAMFIVETGSTVRTAAKKFGLSKSTIHLDITEVLSKVDFQLYKEVRLVLDKNKAERHIRGGAATREVWKNKKSQ